MASSGNAGGSEILNNAPMTPRQVMVVAICVLLNILDGFDVLAITFAAPAISKDWTISLSALGVVMSASLAGMAAGSVVLAPWADRIGRRPIVIISLLLMTLGMALTAFAGSIEALAFYRVVTGLGIGGMIASINAVVAEFANDRRRDLAVSLMTVGYPVGGLLGGLMSAELVDAFGWRSIFSVGAVLTGLALAVIAYGLPESLSFLSSRQAPGDLDKAKSILRRLGHPALAERLAFAPRTSVQRPGPAALLGPELRTVTLLLIGSYFLHIMTFYFYSSWLPQIMAGRGFGLPDAIITSAIMNLGGVLGGGLLGWAAPRFGLKRLAAGSMIGTSIMMAIFGLVPLDLTSLRVVAFLLGIVVFGGVVGLYASLARGFPAALRVTGSGLAIAIGRGGAIVGPILGGVLLDAGFGAGTALTLIGAAATVGAFLLLPIRFHDDGQQN